MSQRCVQPSLIDRVAMALQQPLGLGALGEETEDCIDWDCGDGGGGGWGEDGGSGNGNGAGDDTDPYNFYFDDGSEWHQDPETGDTTFYDSSDGSYYTEFADGGYQFDYADGESYYEDANGNWTWTGADGSTYSGDGSGKWSGCEADGTCYDDQHPGGSKTKADQAKSKAQEAAGKSAAAGSSGGGGGGQKQGGQGQGQPQNTLAQAQALCLQKGWKWTGQTCVQPSGSGLTADQWLRKQFGFGTGAAVAIVAGLLILPSLIKKL